MSGLTIFNYTTLILDLGTIIFLIGLIMVTNVLRRRGRDDDKLFFYLIVIAMAIALADIIGYLSEGRTFYGAKWVQMFGMELLFLNLALIAVIWAQYCRIRFNNNPLAAPSKMRGFIYYPGLLLMTLIITNFSTGWIFTIDDNNTYHKEVMYIPMMVLIFLYFAYGFLRIARYKGHSGKGSLIPVWLFALPFILGPGITFLLRGSSFTAPGIALTIIFTHLGSMNEIADMSLEENKI